MPEVVSASGMKPSAMTGRIIPICEMGGAAFNFPERREIMSETEKFSEKITERLTRHRGETIQRQGQLNADMQELINRRAVFENEARRVLTAIVLPRMESVARHFDNAVLAEPSASDLSCACHFTHTKRHPASVSLTVTIEPGPNYEKLNLHQSLEILPEFIDYERQVNLQVDPGSSSDEETVRWVEERMLRFLDTYLELETHPVYQKDNLVTDPICGMTLPLVEAAGSVNRDGREIYFCSQVCRDVYLKEIPGEEERRT
jgi:YHS domain-containing protein